VRIPDEVGADLEAVAEATDRSKAYLAAQAIKEYLRREAAFIASVKKGLAQAERGEFASAEEVEAVFAKYRLPSAPKAGK
jgi:predicted transcriptional regulator